MGLRKSCKCAQNLGKYSQRRVRDIFVFSDTFPNLTAAGVQNLNLVQPPNPPPLTPISPPPTLSPRLVQVNSSNSQFFPDSGLESDSDDISSDIFDDVDSVNMAPTTEDMFKKCLFDAQKTLEKLSNVCGHISGHKVKYSGATLNGKHAR
jgi:hypothetical protein